MDASLRDAVLAWAGVYGPLSLSQKFETENNISRPAFTTKEHAAQCLSRRTDTCPLDVCVTKASGRCVPKVGRQIGGPFKINNSMTFDLYSEIFSAIDVRVMFSETTGIAVIPFKTGKVRPRGAIFEKAKLCLDQLPLLELSQRDDVRAIVLCGHSEGGVTAQAVALMCDADLPKMYLVTSAAHLWLYPEEQQKLAHTLGDRTLNFVAALSTTDAEIFDGFCIKTGKDDDDMVSDMVSLPITLLAQTDNGVVCKDAPEVLDTLSGMIEDADGNMYFDSVTTIDLDSSNKFHAWNSYEPRIRAAFGVVLSGGSSGPLYASWLACAAVIVGTLLLGYHT